MNSHFRGGRKEAQTKRQGKKVKTKTESSVLPGATSPTEFFYCCRPPYSCTWSARLSSPSALSCFSVHNFSSLRTLRKLFIFIVPPRYFLLVFFLCSPVRLSLWVTKGYESNTRQQTFRWPLWKRGGNREKWKGRTWNNFKSQKF